jgi:predicted dehydrogenase
MTARLWFSGLACMTILTGAEPLRLVTVDPGHFHAALLQKESNPELAADAFVYAPLGPDLNAHLNRIAAFNNRAANPTEWRLRIYAAPDYWQRLLKEKPGSIAVLSGRNRGKIDRISTLAGAGLHVLADKPWVIEPEDLAKLQPALDAARKRGVVLYDAMTQRYEITCILPKALVNDPAIFGELERGSADQPAVHMDSVHYLLKSVAGVVNLRPAWFFDIREQGEGITDVGTHLVDLVQWTIAGAKPIDVTRDIQVLAASRWPTVLSAADFQRVTGETAFPSTIRESVRADGLHYYCNNSVTYTFRGAYVKLDVKWGFEAAAGQGDSETAIFRGTRAVVEVRGNDVFVLPAAGQREKVAEALGRKVASLQKDWPGLKVEDAGAAFRIAIPSALRIGHEAHFALLARQFLRYVRTPASLPGWEDSFMKAKYYVTTQGVALARRQKP